MTMPLWLAREPLVLASKSAARRAMIEAVGIPLEVAPADIDERAVETRAAAGTASDVATLLAREKARVAAGRIKGRFVALDAQKNLARVIPEVRLEGADVRAVLA